MKKFINIILILLTIIPLAGCTKEKNIQTDGYKFAEEYTSINGVENASGKKNREINIPVDNPMIYSTAEEIVEKIKNNETFVVYFGFPTCPWCRSILEELIKCAKDNNQDKIYYVNVYEIRDKKELVDGEIKTTTKGTDAYMELIDLMSDVLEDYNLTSENGEEVSTEEKRIYAPNVVGIVNGKAEKMATGISTKLKDPYGKLTDEMKEESYNSLKCIFECVGNDENMCKKNAC